MIAVCLFVLCVLLDVCYESVDWRLSSVVRVGMCVACCMMPDVCHVLCGCVDCW